MEILTQLGYRVIQLPAGIDESVKAGETPFAYVQRMAAEKIRRLCPCFSKPTAQCPISP
ncbi:septum formation protein Maf [Neisseria lactamica ATCC 23970]|uniref:Septum formation protein Maf n=1 Tax=Neisseria lactamica ATCC 23970 TaxID=546265 RepID=D0WBQ1_NEILA|nr:septum formation protein Maf [Neisseria lactamica ATCC 23970]